MRSRWYTWTHLLTTLWLMDQAIGSMGEHNACREDILVYDFLSVTKDGFVLVSIQPTSKAQHCDAGFQ
jgi:hypothetical protein